MPPRPAEVKLELDTESEWLHRDSGAAPEPVPLRKPGTVVSDLAPPPRFSAGKAVAVIAAVAAVVAIASLAWIYRDEVRDAATGADNVKLTFEVSPASAKVFVAGEHAKGGTIEVARSKKPLVVVIDAVGHETKILEVRPTKDQLLRIVLRRQRGP